MYQDLSMCHDWPFKTAIVDFPIRLKGILKPTSSNLLSLLEAQNKDLCFTEVTNQGYITSATHSNEERTLEKFL